MFKTLFTTNEINQDSTLAIVVSILASVFLSFMLVITYRLTSKQVVERKEFIQGVALISIVASMIMQAIGDSLARGLGMLGALSIIRFRTSLSSPRNMAFMFASLAAGIACGVYGFTIAFIGTLSFCIVAFALAWEGGCAGKQLVGDLRINIEPTGDRLELLESLIQNYTSLHKLYEVRFTPPKKVPPENIEHEKKLLTKQELNYQLLLKEGVNAQDLVLDIEQLDGIINQRLRFAQGRETL